MKIAIVGSGKLSKALVDKLPQLGPEIHTEKVADFSSSNIDFCIHTGSGREWNQTLELCAKKSIPLIQASTPSDQLFPDAPTFVGIYAPNFCISVLKFQRLSYLIKALYPSAKISLTESHQREKSTRAATAERLAKLVGIPSDEIQHIRDESVQLELGIPEDALAHHAYHELKLEDKSAELKFSCKVTGADAYAEGAYALIDYLRRTPLANGIYYLEDLIEDTSFEALAPSFDSTSC